MKIKIKYYTKTFVKESLSVFRAIFFNVLSLCSVIVQSDFFCKDIKKIKKIKFDEIVVMGNGPSLVGNFKEHIDFFSGKAIACVNDFAVSEYFHVLKPDFSIFFDSCYWIKNPSKSRCTINDQVYKSFREKVNWPVTMIMPLVAREWNWFIDLPKLNKNINICYVNWTRIDCSKNLRNFLYKNNIAMPRVVNVLINALVIAINMGYRKIYLMGADHSWHENICLGNDNVVYCKAEHFYPEEELSLKPVFRDPEETRRYKMHELFHDLSLTFEGHQEVAEYAEFMRAKIYNVSKKSYIDAYERVTL